ncbi:MAG TPA: hypothetical protein VLA37_03490, partial [Sphingomonadaceae bacterium]|nr:hypothetical protein [Sphingomonadaceae bacterium]
MQPEIGAQYDGNLVRYRRLEAECAIHFLVIEDARQDRIEDEDQPVKAEIACQRMEQRSSRVTRIANGKSD